MKLKTDTPITGLHGEPVMVRDGADEKAAALGRIAVMSLLAEHRNEAATAEEKVRRYRLAMRLSEEVEVEVSPEDVSLIRKLVALAWPPLIVGRVWDMTNG